MEEEARAQIISEYMSAVAQRRRQVRGSCVECSERIEGLTTRRYCSNRCRQRARRARRQVAGLPWNPRRPVY